MSGKCCVTNCCDNDEDKENHRTLFPFPKDEVCHIGLVLVYIIYVFIIVIMSNNNY